jgi:HlyD family secretion protein
VARQRRGAVETYRFVQVTRGDIESTVSATGALSAVRTVQVGTQVSGQIAEIRVDFNDRVRRGQLIARLDTTLLAQAVREAEATLERSRADADRRAFELRQASELWAQRFITETEYRTAQFNATSALTTQRSAEAALDRARQNLAYAYIHAPVNGVVIERNVDVGQTVAASFSAPQLFLIAEDLGRMQILASVAESDIGQITEGQVARFTVQAWPNVTFAGKVKQVRMQSKTQENVVNYSVAVEVDNRDGKLLPGMTATVSFLVDAVRGVLRVPNAALRFKPTAQLLARATRDTVVPADTAVGRAVPAVRGSRDSALRGRAASTAGARALRTGELWLVSPEGRASSRVVRLGLTDGQFTEVTGAGIVEGMQVIAAVIGGETAERATTGTNPFEGNQRPGGRPGPPPGM